MQFLLKWLADWRITLKYSPKLNLVPKIAIFGPFFYIYICSGLYWSLKANLKALACICNWNIFHTLSQLKVYTCLSPSFLQPPRKLHEQMFNPARIWTLYKVRFIDSFISTWVHKCFCDRFQLSWSWFGHSCHMLSAAELGSTAGSVS